MYAKVLEGCKLYCKKSAVFPHAFRRKQNKVIFRRQAVIGHEWAKTVLCNATLKKYFNGFI